MRKIGGKKNRLILQPHNPDGIRKKLLLTPVNLDLKLLR
jgi:hypothetical protein